MKFTKLLLTGSLALAAASFASAQQYIKITGSTAFRGSTNTAIARTLQPPAGFTKVQAAYKGSNLTGANQAIYHGIYNGVDTYVQTGWAGSVGGVQTLATNAHVTLTIGGSDAIVWMSASNPMADVTVSAATAVTGGNAVASPAFDAGATADITMSDSYVTSTKFVGTGYTALTDNNVGVIAFSFVRGKDNIPGGRAAALTNMTTLAFQNLCNNGVVPLSVFTGLNSDNAYDVVLVGRDNDSGTRLAALAETAFGIYGSPLQYNIGTAAAPTAPVADASTDKGYSSGGTMVGAMGVAPVGLSPNGKPYVTVSYAGVNDANTLRGAGGTILSYNGVYTQDTVSGVINDVLIKQGQATFWTTMHLVYRATYGNYGTPVVAWNAAKQLFADGLVTLITGGDATVSGLLLSDMWVDRASEGSPVYYNK